MTDKEHESPQLTQDIEPMNVWYSRPFDVHTWSDHPEINELVEEVYEDFSDDQKGSIKGKSKNKGRTSGKTHLKVLLIDLYVAWKSYD